MPSNYIEMNRCFSVLNDSAAMQQAASQSYLDVSSVDVGWYELLKTRQAVILGEPGSGKSCEFRHRCATLQESGAYAFSVELERLVFASFDDVLSPRDLERFQQWLATDQPAHLFLDSVDEAKLRRRTDFYTALDKVHNALGKAVDRAHVLISSRISEWQPETDRQEVMQRFGPISSPKIASNLNKTTDDLSVPSVLIVQLEPLNREQVRVFIKGRGIANPEQFLQALDKHSAWEFARRPVDVIDLAEFWTVKERLGSLTEIIEHDIASKLKETTLRHTNSPLSEESAHAGAEALAAATIFCKQQQFKVPDDSFLAGDALNAARCLPADWSPKEIAALLSRPLFDSAIYGRIRFHHRRVAEFLAATWLRKRMAEGCPSHVLQDLLFQDLHGKKVARRSLLPVIAWLCPGNERWNEDVRADVLEASPEIFLQYGDAEALPVVYRRDLLRSWINRNKERERVFLQSSYDALRRLAAPELADDVSQMLVDKNISLDMREELVQLVRHGKLTVCMPTLLTILADTSEPESLKANVLEAVRNVGTPNDRRKVWEILRPVSPLPVTTCSLACETLYPDTISPFELVTLLQKPSASNRQWNNHAWKVQQHLDKATPREHYCTLIAELNRLVQFPPCIVLSNNATRISKEFEWVLNLLHTLLAKLLAESSLSQEECEAAVEALSLLGESIRLHSALNDEEKRTELNAATHNHPVLRRMCFWQAVARFRHENPSIDLQLHHVFGYSSALVAGEADLAWLISDIESAPKHKDRLLALQLTLRVLGGWNDRYAHRLHKAIRGDAVLTAELRAAHSGSRFVWIRRMYYCWTSGARWKHWWLMRKHALSRWRQRLKDKWFLWRHRNALRSGKEIGMLALLCREAEASGTKWGPSNWDTLAARRGRKTADAVREGCMRAWRNHKPQLPHEKTQPNEVEYHVVVGLAGLQILCTNEGFSFESFTDDDARLATRYAVNEMNGFPDWFAPLAAAKPIPVGEVLRKCVLGEWAHPTERQLANDVLANIAWEGGTVAQLVRTDVLECLAKGDPAHPAVRDAAISLALKTATICDAQLTEIAVERCRQAPIETVEFARWCAVWMQNDADACLTFLSEHLSDGATADAAVLRICSLLDGGVRQRMPLLANPSYLEPLALRRWIPLVYRHLRPTEDIDRSGQGAYTPTERDDARRFRDSLLVRLSQSDDAKATGLLRELITERTLADQRDWILHLLDDRVKKEADSSAWDPVDIRGFAEEYEIDPKTDRDLFQIIVGRFIDIKNNVERGENSLREEVPSGADEYVLRRWLARKLVERSRQRYTIPQEEEIDQQQRPDLRAENPKTNPVSIEIKWADNWSISKLITGLETQLVGQYLRDHHSRYGIYVLAMQGNTKHWIMDSQKLKFLEVKDLIDSCAKEIVSTNQDVECLHVIGIDFRNPPDLA